MTKNGNSPAVKQESAPKPTDVHAERLHKLYTPLSYPHVYLAVAQQRSISTEQVLSHAGLNPDLLSQPAQRRISPLQYALLIRAVLDLTGNHGLGFEIGKK